MRIRRASRGGTEASTWTTLLVALAISGVMLLFPRVACAADPVVLDERSGKIAWSGSWRSFDSSSAIGGTERRTSKAGSSVFVEFEGTAIRWLGSRGPTGGAAAVYLDGSLVATVSQDASETTAASPSWETTGLAHGRHSLRIKALDSRRTICVDSLSIAGTVLQAYAPSPFHYEWRNYIVIDKSRFRLYLVKSGKLVKSYPVAHGKIGWATPVRVWRVGAKYRTSPGGVYGPRKMRLFKRVRTRHGYAYVRTAYGIHGTNQEWVIGTRASHGCIRMYNKDVRDLYPRVPIGTMVITRD